MVTIGGYPIIWHIMRTYAHFGFKEFVVALGYRGDIIKDYFLDHRFLTSDLTVKIASGEVVIHGGDRPEWTVHLIDTGLDTATGGRVKRLSQWLGEETFMLTYGDGLADIDLAALVEYHRSHGRLATVTAVRPPARFGGLEFEGDRVKRFSEKPQIGEGWINGGFFVLEPKVLDNIADDSTSWEHEPLEKLAADGQLVAFRHDSFWQPMDTLREVRILEALWADGRPPWKVWG